MKQNHGLMYTFYSFGENFQFSSVQSLSRIWLFVTPWIAALQASLSITNSRSSPRLTSIESVMPSSHLILGRPLLLLPPIPPSLRVFANESTLCMRWPKYWSFSFSISPSSENFGSSKMYTVQQLHRSYYYFSWVISGGLSTSLSGENCLHWSFAMQRYSELTMDPR